MGEQFARTKVDGWTCFGGVAVAVVVVAVVVAVVVFLFAVGQCITLRSLDVVSGFFRECGMLNVGPSTFGAGCQGPFMSLNGGVLIVRLRVCFGWGYHRWLENVQWVLHGLFLGCRRCLVLVHGCRRASNLNHCCLKDRGPHSKFHSVPPFVFDS